MKTPRAVVHQARTVPRQRYRRDRRAKEIRSARRSMRGNFQRWCWRQLRREFAAMWRALGERGSDGKPLNRHRFTRGVLTWLN